MIWTERLEAAALMVSREPVNVEGRESLMRDIKSRVEETLRCMPGDELVPYQVEFLQLIRSRMGDAYLRELPSYREFEAAFVEAYGR